MNAASRNEKTIQIKKKATAIGASHAPIVFARAPFIQYLQILLTKNFRRFLETIMLSSKVLHMGIQKSTVPKNIRTSGWFTRIQRGL